MPEKASGGALQSPAPSAPTDRVELSVVMPCLNEEQAVGWCVERALAGIERTQLRGEVVVCDNDSRDRSIEIAERAGARVVREPKRGYGRAYLTGLDAAWGRLIVIGDSDCSYDFLELHRLIGPLLEGYDYVLGSRLAGSIMPGAMPFLNRYLGNPALTALLNLLFGLETSDAHSGMRAFTKNAYERMGLRCEGMEFASEVVVAAARAGLRVAEVPITYHPRRGRSKLRRFRDGARHVRFMLAEALVPPVREAHETLTSAEVSLAAVASPPAAAPARAASAPARPGVADAVNRFGGQAGRVLREHWLIAAFVLVGVLLRAAVSVAYWPGLELYDDSYDYLRLAHVLVPGNWHPSGYPLLLAMLSFTRQLGVVVVVQHLMGIATGLVVYWLVLRLGARRWVAALAALPVLLDGYQLDLEQMILPEALTSLLLVGALAVVAWRERVGALRGAAAGLLLAAATVTRTATLPVLFVVGLYLMLRGGRWRGLLSYCAVAAAVLVAYGGWYGATYGSFGYSDYAGYWLYGRVAPFATCDYKLPWREAVLCPLRPVSQRSDNPEFFADDPGSPINQVPYLGSAHARNVLGERFAITVIEHQPLDYASAVLADVWHYFTPGRWMTADDVDMVRWRFPPPRIDPQADNYHVSFARAGFNGPIKASPDAALMGPLRSYQSLFYTPGPLLLACLIAALLAALGLVRARTGRRQARWAALMLALCGVVIVLMPSLTVQFSYRYGLPLLVLLVPAGAAALDIGLDALARRRQLRGSAASRAALACER